MPLVEEIDYGTPAADGAPAKGPNGPATPPAPKAN